jgi:hypothetical protein
MSQAHETVGAGCGPTTRRRVYFDAGAPSVRLVDSRTPETAYPDLILETRSDILWSAVTERYGRDHICIGYGAIISIVSPRMLGSSAHEKLLDLITSFPSWRDHFRHHPVRLLSYVARDAGMRFALRRRITSMLGRRRAGDAMQMNPLYDLGNWM